DPRAVVMDLHERVSEAYRTGGVDIESNEDKRAMVALPILADILIYSPCIAPMSARNETGALSPVPVPSPRIWVSMIIPLKSPISDGSLICVRAVGTAG